MTQAHKTPGAIVELHEKCFVSPYAPHFDYLKNKKFFVVKEVYANHMEIKEIKEIADGNAPIVIVIHDDELKTVDKKIVKRLGFRK
jgi:hypothetical protein